MVDSLTGKESDLVDGYVSGDMERRRDNNNKAMVNSKHEYFL
jgi:hypothetical protein